MPRDEFDSMRREHEPLLVVSSLSKYRVANSDAFKIARVKTARIEMTKHVR